MRRGQRHADELSAPVSLKGESICFHPLEEQRIQMKERERIKKRPAERRSIHKRQRRRLLVGDW